ncbi:MAG: DUF7146 domain-containing protein [Marinosulfonomonas sp.]
MMDALTLTNNAGGFWRNGKGSAPCPICQPEHRKDQVALSISEANGKILLHCFKTGCSFVEIANALNMPLETAQIDFEAQKEHQRKQAEYAQIQHTRARSLWDYAVPISGTKAEAYLRGRGIECPMPESLRFVADLYHAPSAAWVCAMVADVQPAGGVHRTFFDKTGQRLTKSAKMMLGPCSGGAVRLSDGKGPLVACEGIETGLSLVQLLADRSPEVWATLSTSGMKALNLPSGSRELIIAADGDEPGAVAANSLATRATALGWQVSMMPAPDGQDWNDVLQSGVAA